MASTDKLCQADDEESCPNVACAFCYHCSRNLCLDHLTEHSQLIDALTRSVLEENFKILTSLSTRLQSLNISSNILNGPFLKIEQWRIDAYRHIDEIVEKKFEEIHSKINEYRIVFDRMRNEQLTKIGRYRQKIAELFRETQIANRDLSLLKKSIDKMKNELNNFDQHTIEVLPYRAVNHSVQIRMKLNDWKLSTSSSPTSSSSSSVSSITQLLEFKIKFVQLTGFVSIHYVLVSVNGTVRDLIEQFMHTQDQTIRQKRNHLLATEVCQSRIRQRFPSDIQLKTIFNQINELVLYETPFELNSSNLQQYCLILCRFEDGLPWNIHFGLPILLHVPRFQCRGKDVIDVLDNMMKACFPLIIRNNDVHYEVRIASDDHQISSTTILNQWADQVIDDHLLMADNATLIVNLITNHQTYDNESINRLARLDGILKSSEKRRKSRK